MNQITVLVTVVLGAIAAGLIVVLHQLQAGAVVAVLAVLVFFGLKMANNWERFVIPGNVRRGFPRGEAPRARPGARR